MEILERIESLLKILVSQNEKILESYKPKAHTALRKKENPINGLIAIYVRSWQKRYGTNARPDVGRVSQGILKRISSDLNLNALCQYIEVYCQMDDAWFVQKRHDLATFEKNLNKISLALDKGHERTDLNWTKIFGEDGQRILPKTNGPDDKDLGGQDLPSRETSLFLEGVSKRNGQ